MRAETGGQLSEKLQKTSYACTKCDLCQKECAFLQKYGKPKDIADRYDPSKTKDWGMPFECSLCGLCNAVCPAGIDLAGLFLEMRREAVRHGEAGFPEHAVLERYARRGTSRTYSYYGLPEGCDTVFFPGCTLSGTRSDKVILAYHRLKENIPCLGIVLDCCMKPSHDLGQESRFHAMLSEMENYLVRQGVKTVLAACPGCYRMFARYGTGLSTKTIYEVLAQDGLGKNTRPAGTVTIHDPCTVRFDEQIHGAVRELVKKQGFTIEEMDHAGLHTLCCGEGGGVDLLTPDLAAKWAEALKHGAAGRKVVTYCAGCASRLGKVTPTVHVLDILWKKEGKPARTKVTRPPFTYWKRMRLKKWFKKHVSAAVTRERAFIGKDRQKKNGMMKFLIFLLSLAVVIAMFKTSGVSRYLDQHTVRTWIGSYGTLAPIVYMLFYAIAPALFLPGLPITIAGGILFGSFWGVVYTIIGSTMGACIAFLVSRYLAREWVEGQLKSPRWKRLDEGVERHGWKVVALTRLIPLFPFNLLNYAFGLTGIGFRQYAVTTFICMLPACIAFIVFSSSLLDLVRGKISLTFVIGLVLVVLVSIFPILYRRNKAKRGKEGPL